MVPDETSDLPTTLPEASFLNPNRKVPSEARSLRGLFPVPVFAEFPSYSLSKNADGFLQNPFWLSYCNLRKLKGIFSPSPRPRFSDAFVHNRICRSASPRRWPPPSWDRVTDRRTQSAFQKKRTETRRPLLLSDRSDTPLYRRSSAPLHRWIASIRPG